MSKTSSKSPPPSGPATKTGGSSHLDDKIADVTTKTVQGVKRHHILLLSALGVALAAVLVANAMSALKKQELNDLSAREHELLSSLKAQDADVVASIPQINDLLTSARGKPVEQSVYRRATEYFLHHSRLALFPKPDTPASSIPGQPPAPSSNEPETTLDKSKVPEVLEQAKTIVTEAQKLFPNDSDLQLWATESLNRVETLRELGKEPTATDRSFSPPLPEASK